MRKLLGLFSSPPKVPSSFGSVTATENSPLLLTPFLAGEHLCALPGGDGDGFQCTAAIEDADSEQQSGESNWHPDLVSRYGSFHHAS